MRELIYFSTRLVGDFYQTRSGGRIRRRLGIWRLLPLRVSASLGLGPANVSVSPIAERDPRKFHASYDRLRRATRRRLARFPDERISPRGHPYVEFTVEACWGYMGFLGVGIVPNQVTIDGTPRHNILTFWLQGKAPDGSVIILVGSADNVLSFRKDVVTESGMRLDVAFDYPSSTDALTALVQAVNPHMKVSLPLDDRRMLRRIDEVDILSFALELSERTDVDIEEDTYYDEDEDGVVFNKVIRRIGAVSGLARVYAAGTGAQVKAVAPHLDWLGDQAQVVVGAPYGLYAVSHVAQT